jgi:hypothetical protein
VRKRLGGAFVRRGDRKNRPGSPGSLGQRQVNVAINKLQVTPHCLNYTRPGNEKLFLHKAETLSIKLISSRCAGNGHGRVLHDIDSTTS